MNLDTVARQQMACLGDASRYRIVGELSVGRACVTELAARIGLSQSCTTRHLQALERAGLVSRERAGRRVLFGVRSESPAVRSLLDWKLRLETDADFASAGSTSSDLGEGEKPGRSGASAGQVETAAGNARSRPSSTSRERTRRPGTRPLGTAARPAAA